MNFLLKLLGRGLDNDLTDLLDHCFWTPPADAQGNGPPLQADQSQERLDSAIGQWRDGDLDQAIEALTSAREEFANNFQIAVALAAALHEHGDVREAIVHFTAAENIQPSETAVTFAIGLCCEKLEHINNAEACYRRALKSNFSYVPALSRLAAVSLILGNIDQATEQVERLLEVFPNESGLRTTLAQLSYYGGQYEQATEYFETAIAMGPENWSLVDDQVEELIIAGKNRQAIERLVELIEAQGDSADLHLRLGDLYSRCGDDEMALKHFSMAISREPDYLEAKVKIGTHHLVCGRWEQAAEAFHSAAELNDQILINYIGLGVSQLSAGQTEDSANSFDLAAAIEPNSSLLLTETARLQLRAAMKKAVVVDYNDSGPDIISEMDNDALLQTQVHRHCNQVRLHRSRADIKYRYGVLLRNQGRTSEAITQFFEAATIKPSYIEALIKLGIAQRENQMTEQAIASFSQAMELDQVTLRSYYELALLYADGNKLTEKIRRKESTGQDGELIRAQISLSLQQMGLMDSAAATWRSLWQIHQASI